MPDLIAFSYQDAPLRIELDGDGEPLFHAGDLCAILGYANPWDAVRRHVEPEDIVKREVTSESDKPTARKTQQVNFVREPGMWSLILGSETAAAKPVKRWVTAEVLPAIRKTGGYLAPSLANELADLRAEVASLKKCLPAPKPKRSRHDVIRDKVAAYLARHRPAFISIEHIGEEVLHKRPLTRAERNAVNAGVRQMGYQHNWGRG